MKRCLFDIFGFMLILALSSAYTLGKAKPIRRRTPREVAYEETREVAYEETRHDYRLPANLKPLKYNISIVVPSLSETNLNFSGNVGIEVNVQEDTKNIVLHAKVGRIDINASTIEVRDSNDSKQFTVIHSSNNNITDHFTITVNETLLAGKKLHISMHFSGIMGFDYGLYMSSYMNAGEPRWTAATEMQPIHARETFPCFDEPALKAQFQINICHEASLHSISNMPLERTTQVSDTVCDHFQDTPLMSTYLVAFVLSDFANISNPEGTLRIFAQPSKIQQAEYSLSISPRIMAWLEEYTGIEYKLPKMDQVAVLNEAGAMENWGLVAYSEKVLLVEEGVTTAQDKQEVAITIAHELSHQWFGNLVTAHWWQDLWLQEGFAQYMGYYAAAYVEKTWRLEEQFVPRILQEVMDIDLHEGTHELSYNASTKDEPFSGFFSPIDYYKGASVIRMMKHIVSEITFQKGLQNYLLNRSFDIATPTDLFAHMDQQYQSYNRNKTNLPIIQKVMGTWINQKGYPVIHINRDYNISSATVTQERFYKGMTDTNTDDTHNYKWHIPLSYTTQEELDFQSTSPREWLNADNSSLHIGGLPGSDKWILFNIQETGYYRVNYDAQNWKLLAEYLNSPDFESIHLLNRAQLIDDCFHLARAGIIKKETLLELSRYLAREVDYIPWISVFRGLDKVHGEMMKNEDYPTFQAYIRKLISKLYEHVGFEVTAKDDHSTRMIRADVINWACKMDLEDCINSSKTKLHEWMTSGNNSVGPDVLNHVYCAAIRHSGKEEWDFLWEEYLKTRLTDDVLHNHLLGCLGCTRDRHAISSYINKIILPVLSKGVEPTSVLGDLFQHRNPSLVDHLIEYVITMNNSDILTNLARSVGGHLYTQAQINKFKGFFRDKNITISEGILKDSFGSEAIAWMKNEVGLNISSEISSKEAPTSIFRTVLRYGVSLLSFIATRHVM